MRLIEERVRLHLLTLTDMARKLGVPYQTLAGRVRTGTFPAPTRSLPVGRRKYYSSEDAERHAATYKNGEEA
jgi:hypothetical protein